MNTPLPLAHPVCPGWDTLVGLKLGQLTDVERNILQDHLSHCPSCRRALHEIDSGSPHDLGNLKRYFNFIDRPLLAEAHVEAGDDGSTAPYTKVEALPDRWLGQKVGPYVVATKLGQGGMGVVYRAEQPSLCRFVALKMILGGVHASDQHFARFRTESKAVARLQHPNVVQIHDFAEQDGVPYYAMELVEGGSLSARLRQGPMVPRDAAELVRTLASALAAAHDKKILHRDLKPSNVLLTRDGTPKIADFGLAKLLDVETQTRSDALLGTPAYMAPEQANGQVADIDPRTDVYALGVILYECLTGSVPLRGRTPFETMTLVRSTEPLAPSRRRPGVPAGLDDVCLKCLEKSPERRYPTAQALADDLGRWLRGEPVTATRRLGHRLLRSARRHVALIGLGLSALVLMGVSLATPLPPLEKLQREVGRKRPVTFVGATGKPAWFRWRMGDTSSQVSGDKDSPFTVHSARLALVELMPDPGCERYRFAARVRHFQGDPRGEIGVYFGRQSAPGTFADLHSLARVTYNDVTRQAFVPPNLPKGANLKPRDNSVQLKTLLVSELDRAEYLWNLHSCANGPSFQAAGEHKGVYHRLEVEVTHGRVKVTWDGQPFATTPQEIQERISASARSLRSKALDDPFIQRFHPTFQARGGLGLYVLNGSASYQDVTLTPLTE